MKTSKLIPELKSRNSLGQMLELLRDLDDDMLPEMFDAAELIGDIREKIDGIKWKLDDWEYKAKMIEERFILPLKRRVRSIKGKHTKLERYVTDSMTRLNVEKIPGDLCRVNLQKSTPHVEVNIEADAMMYLNYPEIVIQETTYRWDKNEIARLAKLGEKYTFAEVKQNKHIKFYTQGEMENERISDTTGLIGSSEQESAAVQVSPAEGVGSLSGETDSGSTDGV